LGAWSDTGRSRKYKREAVLFPLYAMKKKYGNGGEVGMLLG